MGSNSAKIVYKELLDKYYSLIRRTSYIHINILSKFEETVNNLIDEVDNLILDEQSFDFDKNFILKFRKLLFKLDNVLNVDVLNEYNSIIDSVNINLSSSMLNNSSMSTSKEIEKYDVESNNFNNIPSKVWEDVLLYLRENLNKHTFNVWVKPTNFHSFRDNVINISVQNSYFKNWLDEHCSSMIKNHLSSLDLDYDVKFITA